MAPKSTPRTSTRNGLFRRRLIAWFRRHGRKLPWRDTRDPYHVLVSEVMLQQTQVSRVEGYYGRFLARFPDVQTLAGPHPRGFGNSGTDWGITVAPPTCTGWRGRWWRHMTERFRTR
jgi:hypothetical protein